ncbi:hypothetical protein IEQ34_005258 [Dendrobium chrysotoxum]|uniref:Uncharacterized protein n=1 Tax=Dendrobium chrysotoxum TaxID=161865 RepID=A0AAV7HCF0_DENCH|nr:hypothetical protein IEQ34_005258 [Dendrobium chrysotoxum]
MITSVSTYIVDSPKCLGHHLLQYLKTLKVRKEGFCGNTLQQIELERYKFFCILKLKATLAINSGRPITANKYNQRSPVNGEGRYDADAINSYNNPYAVEYNVLIPEKIALLGILFQNHVKEVSNILKLVRHKFRKESYRNVMKHILSNVEIPAGTGGLTMWEGMEEASERGGPSARKLRATTTSAMKGRTEASSCRHMAATPTAWLRPITGYARLGRSPAGWPSHEDILVPEQHHKLSSFECTILMESNAPIETIVYKNGSDLHRTGKRGAPPAERQTPKQAANEGSNKNCCS